MCLFADVNECDAPTSCDATTSTCVDTDGSYTCTCAAGYLHADPNDAVVCTGASNSYPPLTCVVTRLCYSDENECDAGTDSCDASISTCSNTIGSYTCTCSTGYAHTDATVDAITCISTSSSPGAAN